MSSKITEVQDAKLQKLAREHRMILEVIETTRSTGAKGHLIRFEDSRGYVRVFTSPAAAIAFFDGVDYGAINGHG